MVHRWYSIATASRLCGAPAWARHNNPGYSGDYLEIKRWQIRQQVTINQFRWFIGGWFMVDQSLIDGQLMAIHGEFMFNNDYWWCSHYLYVVSMCLRMIIDGYFRVMLIVYESKMLLICYCYVYTWCWLTLHLYVVGVVRVVAHPGEVSSPCFKMWLMIIN